MFGKGRGFHRRSIAQVVPVLNDDNTKAAMLTPAQNLQLLGVWSLDAVLNRECEIAFLGCLGPKGGHQVLLVEEYRR